MKRILLPLLAGALCLLSACNESSSTASTDKASDPRYAGRVAVSLDNLTRGKMLAFELDSLQIQVKDAWGNYLGDNVIDLRLTNTLLIQNIRPGQVYVEASAWRPGTSTYWYGRDSVHILPMQTALAKINLAPATGALMVSINLDSSMIHWDSLHHDTIWRDTIHSDTILPPRPPLCQIFDTLPGGRILIDSGACHPIEIDTTWQTRCLATYRDSAVCIPGWHPVDSLPVDSVFQDSLRKYGILSKGRNK